MAALLAFVIVVFAPVVGFEPGRLDDWVTRAYFYPEWRALVIFGLGGLVELVVLVMLIRWLDARISPHGDVPRASRWTTTWTLRAVVPLAASYGAATLVGMAAAFVIRWPVWLGRPATPFLWGLGSTMLAGTLGIAAWFLWRMYAELGRPRALGSVAAVVLCENAASLGATVFVGEVIRRLA